MAIATTIPTENTPPRLLLISVPRTASNLLLKILDIHNIFEKHTLSKGLPAHES